MGLAVALQNESGEALETISDDNDFLHSLLPPQGSSYMLGAVDWYGDTVFNRLQMKQFLAEWELVQNKASSPEQRSLVAEIKKLAVRCHKEVHLYLKFVGD
jgi:hypothetical protein